MQKRSKGSKFNFNLVSLGCAKNLTDSEYIISLLAQAGGRRVKDIRRAEIIIVNTCAFIEIARQEAINTILLLAEYKKTARCRGLLVCGCLSQMYGRELLDEIPEVDAVLGAKSWPLMAEVVFRVLAGERQLVMSDESARIAVISSRILVTPAYSAYLKISDGCNNNCTYCAIPRLRGSLSSHSAKRLLAEAGNLVVGGVRELNVIAQDTTNYGSDWGLGPQLVPLLSRLLVLPGLAWLRLMYCYPRHIDDRLLELMVRQPKMCRYLDIPLQHIDDDILQAMGRRDTADEIWGLLAKIRRIMPDIAIRTTFIVGFPGEGEQRFSCLEKFIRQQDFDHVGVFKYSREENTPAYFLSGQVAEEVKEERYHRLMALQATISEKKNRSWQGRELAVLVEGRHEALNDGVYGRSYREAPDVDGRIYIENAPGVEPGDIIACRITQGFAYDLVGEKT